MLKKTVFCLFVMMCMALPASAEMAMTRYDNLSNNKDQTTAKPIAAFKEKVDFLLVNEKWEDLYAVACAETKKFFNQEQFVKMLTGLSKRVGGFEKVELLEIHLLESSGEGRAPVRDGKSIILPNPVQLNRPLTGTIAFVLCEAKSKKGPFFNWLTYVFKKEQGRWALGSFQINLSRVSGKRFDWYLKKADDFEKAGMKRNALLYKMIGYQLLNPGDLIVVPSAAQGFQACMAEKDPAVLQLPFSKVRPERKWKTQVGELTVTDVAPLMHPAVQALQVRYLSRQENVGTAADEADRKALFDYVMKNFPEFQEAFDQICVLSVTKSKKAQIKCYRCGKKN